MSHYIDWVDGWEIHSRPDGGYGVYDAHGLVAGPYGTKDAALKAALQLPKPRQAGTRHIAEAGDRH
jgi:hypothetical protein